MNAFLYIAFVAAVVFSAAQAQSEQETECGRRPNLTCFLIPTLTQTLEGQKSEVRGSMSLTPLWQDNQCFTRVTGVVTGLGDNTPHGIHIHELGDISAPDGSSTGGHYNLFGNQHALPDQGDRVEFHVGDLGNLFPDDTGRAEFDVLYSDPISTWALVGRSIVIHAEQDQGNEVQPTGGADARLAVLCSRYSRCIASRARYVKTNNHFFVNKMLKRCGGVPNKMSLQAVKSGFTLAREFDRCDILLPQQPYT